MQKILILKGLPASGKSTWAREYVRKNPGWKRINKDELRDMLDDGKWSKANEKFVLNVRDELIREALRNGYNVIIDDTNFHSKHEENIRKMAEAGEFNFAIKVEVKFFDISINECIKRDLKRQKSVGEKVIRDMYNQFLRPKPQPIPPNINAENAIICDIDGTLALMHNRGPYEWEKVLDDNCNGIVVELLKKYKLQHDIILVSGRDGSCRELTEKWLKKHKIPYDYLFMRESGDNRKDAIIKKEIFDREIRGKFNIMFVLDDRDQVVDMWRNELGLTCLQVAEGNF